MANNFKKNKKSRNNGNKNNNVNFKDVVGRLKNINQLSDLSIKEIADENDMQIK